MHLPNYPFQLEPNNQDREILDREMRVTSVKMWKDDAKTKAASKNISRNTAKLLNNAPIPIKNVLTISSAKNEIRKYCRTFEL